MLQTTQQTSGIASSIPIVGDAAKELRDGVAVQRAERDARRETPAVKRWEAFMAQGVYEPTAAMIADLRPQMDELIQSGKLRILIPMREIGGGGVPGHVLKYLIQDRGMPREFITVANHESGPNAVNIARQWGVKVVDVMEVIHCLSPDVVEVTGLPKLEHGKGVAVLAGLLALRQQVGNGASMVEWIMLHDSELKDVEPYDPVGHLLYPIVMGDGDHHNEVIMNQVGRSNEPVYSVRMALEAIEHMNPWQGIENRLDSIRPAWLRAPIARIVNGLNPWKEVHGYVKAIRPAMLRRVWMCCGERLLSWHDLQRLPLATGYVLETMLGFGIEGLNLHAEKMLAQVVNRNLRRDAANGLFREQLMMGQIARAILAFALFAKNPHKWSDDDIRHLNSGFGRMPIIPGMPETPGHAMAWEQPADRVLPSVDRIFHKQWADLDRLAEVLKASHTPSYS